MDIYEFFFNEKSMQDFGRKIERTIRIKKTTKTKGPETVEEEEITEIDETIEEKPEQIKRENTERHEMRLFRQFLPKMTFKGSCFTKATLLGFELTNLGYGAIIREIYDFIGNVEQIKRHSTIPIMDGKFTQKGYVYLPSLNISVQGVTADRSMKEIFSQILGNDYQFQMEVSCYPRKWILYNE